jgi:CHAD domain-containing protein
VSVAASRAFRLKDGEPVPEGIRRIACGRIDDAIDELGGKADSSPEEAVHEARKDMKKLRALLRLVRGEIGDKTFRRESDSFRDAARELAGVRDADVMLATLTELEERYPAELPADAAGGLRQALEAHRIRTAAGTRGQASAAAIEMLKQARGRVPDWPLERDGFDALQHGLRRAYSRGRRDWRAAQKESSTEHLHEWRKRAKDLWYHCSILQETWKPVMKALADEAHELSDRLGDDHDLAVLLAWAHEHATTLDGMDRVHAFEDVVRARREELQAEAFAYGARLYADKPGAFTKRMERWWRASTDTARAEAAHH